MEHLACVYLFKRGQLLFGQLDNTPAKYLWICQHCEAVARQSRHVQRVDNSRQCAKSSCWQETDSSPEFWRSFKFSSNLAICPLQLLSACIRGNLSRRHFRRICKLVNQVAGNIMAAPLTRPISVLAIPFKITLVDVEGRKFNSAFVHQPEVVAATSYTTVRRFGLFPRSLRFTSRLGCINKGGKHSRSTLEQNNYHDSLSC